MWYNNATNQDCKALQRVVRLAERISGSTLPSLQGIYLNAAEAELLKSPKTQTTPGNHLFILLPSGRRYRSMLAKTERLKRKFLPPGHQAPNSGSITSTGLNIINCNHIHYSPSSTLPALCTSPVQPICTFSCTAHFISLHILHPYFISLFVSYFILNHICIYIYSHRVLFIVFLLLLCYFFLFFALSIERTCPD